MPRRLIKNPTSSRKMKQSYLPSNENLLLLLGDLAVRPFPLHQDLPFKRKKKTENKKKIGTLSFTWTNTFCNSS